MKKIPTIFNRNPEDMKELLNEPHPDCDWVFNGEGVATRKYDGTCCLIKDGALFKRREIKIGKKVPDEFIIADADDNTGKMMGWMPTSTDNPEDKYHIEGFIDAYAEEGGEIEDGTYELLGPKIQGNPEVRKEHTLLKHSEAHQYKNVPREYEVLKEWLKDKDIEGLVWHHPDGRMAKIKKKDFGLKRKA